MRAHALRATMSGPGQAVAQLLRRAVAPRGPTGHAAHRGLGRPVPGRAVLRCPAAPAQEDAHLRLELPRAGLVDVRRRLARAQAALALVRPPARVPDPLPGQGHGRPRQGQQADGLAARSPGLTEHARPGAPRDRVAHLSAPAVRLSVQGPRRPGLGARAVVVARPIALGRAIEASPAVPRAPGRASSDPRLGRPTSRGRVVRTTLP